MAQQAQRDIIIFGKSTKKAKLRKLIKVLETKNVDIFIISFSVRIGWRQSKG